MTTKIFAKFNKIEVDGYEISLLASSHKEQVEGSYPFYFLNPNVTNNDYVYRNDYFDIQENGSSEGEDYLGYMRREQGYFPKGNEVLDVEIENNKIYLIFHERYVGGIFSESNQTYYILVCVAHTRENAQKIIDSFCEPSDDDFTPECFFIQEYQLKD